MKWFWKVNEKLGVRFDGSNRDMARFTLIWTVFVLTVAIILFLLLGRVG